jgi:hypothetical protein
MNGFLEALAKICQDAAISLVVVVTNADHRRLTLAVDQLTPDQVEAVTSVEVHSQPG